MNSLDLYHRAPIPVQNLLTSAEGLRLRRQRFGRDYQQYRAVLRTRDYTDRARLSALQDQEFAAFVRYAAANSPFYRQFYADVDISAVRGAKDVQMLPVLEKEMVQRNLEQIYTVGRDQAISVSTSGTTGQSLTVRYVRRDQQRRLAYLDNFKAKHGFENLQMRRASFTSSKIVPPQQRKPVYWRTNLAGRQRIYSGFHCYGAALPYFVQDLLRYRPHSLDGYPSAIYRVAAYMLEHGMRPSHPPVAVFPTAEALLPHHQEAIEAAFGCRVFDQYASSEGAPFVVMCEVGNRHYCLDTGVIEDGDTRGALVTGFQTHGTPLIRYRVGDSITLAPASLECDCGSGLPLVESLAGRTLDFLYTADRRKVTAVFLSLVSQEFGTSIKAMQYRQERVGEVKILLHASEDFTPEMEGIIRGKLAYTLGPATQVSIERVSEVPREASGKSRMIINTVPVG